MPEARGASPVSFSSSRSSGSSTAVVAFASMQGMELLTGIGLTLLGSMLPAIAARWHLDDARAGWLLLAVFAGSSIGAMLVRTPLYRSLLAGMLAVAASMAALAAGQGRLQFLSFFVFGAGLGLAMTANSLLTGQRYPRRRAAMLTVLNFSWSAGAALSPFAVHLALKLAGVTGVFWTVAACAAAGALLSLTLRGSGAAVEDAGERTVQADGPRAAQANAGRMVVFFAVFGLLYCGAEAALGGWVLTYVHRLDFHMNAAPPLAASCFWLSLLVGRAVAPAVLLRMREERLLTLALVCASLGVVALLTLRPLAAILLAASLAGFSMAPIFPICVSIFLALARDATQARWMFAVAGIGSASLPWATGQLAARTGSLQIGLLVPMAALGAMLLMLRWPGGGVELFRRASPASASAVSPVRAPDPGQTAPS